MFNNIDKKQAALSITLKYYIFHFYHLQAFFSKITDNIKTSETIHTAPSKNPNRLIFDFWPYPYLQILFA